MEYSQTCEKKQSLKSFNITKFSSNNPVLGKELVVVDGKIKKISHGNLSQGTAQTINCKNLPDLSLHIKALGENNAIGLGTAEACKDGAVVPICTKDYPKLGAITRSNDNFTAAAGLQLVLIDQDPKEGEKPLTFDELRAELIRAEPALKHVGMLMLGSASSGAFITGHEPPKHRIGGIHCYLLITKGSDLKKLKELLGKRLWLSGTGYVNVAVNGKRDFRNLIDLAVFDASRLIFEGPPKLGVGLSKLDRESHYFEGEALDVSILVDVTPAEQTRHEMLRNAAEMEVQDEVVAKRAAYYQEKVLSGKAQGLSDRVAKQVASGLIKDDGEILAGCEIDFEGVGKVFGADILRDRSRFDHLECVDVIDSSKGFKGKFFAPSGWFNFFSNGGFKMKLVRHRIYYQHQNQLETMREIDEISSIGRFPDLFNNGGEIVCVDRLGFVTGASLAYLPLHIGKVVEFYILKEDKAGKKQTILYDPPEKFWRAFMQRPNIGLRELKGVSRSPIFDRGRVVTQAGFDHETGLFLAESFTNIDNALFKIANKKKALAAMRRIEGHLSGFPFKTPLDKAATLVAMLTVMQRPLLPSAPVFIISASTPATEKSELSNGLGILGTGQPPMVMPFRPEENEQSKMLLSIFRECQPVVVFDNVGVGVPFGGDPLNVALTSSTFSDRLLSLNKTARFATNSTTFIANGNNPSVKGDTCRRSISVTLDADMENPEDRIFPKTFREICTEHRPEILSDLLIILSAFHNEKPATDVRVVGSFEKWCREIVAPVKWLTGLDVSEARPAATSDESLSMYGEFLELWKIEIGSCIPKTLAEACAYTQLRNWVSVNFSDKAGSLNMRRLGKFISNFEKRYVEGLTLYSPRKEHKVKIWELMTQGV